nr:hypothetical protein Iba_chr03fCG1760 [Ipomoea batatas]
MTFCNRNTDKFATSISPEENIRFRAIATIFMTILRQTYQPLPSASVGREDRPLYLTKFAISIDSPSVFNHCSTGETMNYISFLACVYYMYIFFLFFKHLRVVH